jgi:hypothetical protein
MLSDVHAQRAQGREYALIVRVIRAQLESVPPRDGKRYFEQIDRIEPKALAKQLRLGVERVGCLVEIDRLDDQLRDFPYEIRLFQHPVFLRFVSPEDYYDTVPAPAVTIMIPASIVGLPPNVGL